MSSAISPVGDTVSSAISPVTSWRYCVQCYQSSNQLEIVCPMLSVQQSVGDTVFSAISLVTNWRYCVVLSVQLEILCPVLSV